METVTIKRLRSGDQGTEGELVAGAFTCKTMELPWRDNQHGVSCIPAGVYKAEWRWSPKRQRNIYYIQEVPGRDVIQIHSGNFAGDESLGFQSDVEGCILLGARFAEGVNAKGLPQRAVLESRKTLAAFEAHMKQGPFALEIVDV